MLYIFTIINYFIQRNSKYEAALKFIKKMEMSYMFAIFSILVIIIAIYCKYAGLMHENFAFSGNPLRTTSTIISETSQKPYEIVGTHYSPLISESDSSMVIQKKFENVKAEYEEVLQCLERQWIVMRTSENVTIERSATAYGGPSYLKTTAYFQVPPHSLMQLFYWQNFHRTQSAIDPFFESAEKLFNVTSDCRVIRKTTKRPLVFPKRVFHMALCEHTQARHIDILVHNAWNKLVRQSPSRLSELVNEKSQNTDDHRKVKVPIDEGTIVSSLMTVTVPRDETMAGYVRSFQDFIAWFIDDGIGGTILVILMRVDLGPDIPNWAFLTTVAATGVWSMHAMMKLSRNFPYTKESLPTAASKLNDINSNGRGWHRKLLDKFFRPKGSTNA